MAHPPKLLDQFRATLRRKRYAIRTEEAYMSRSTRYLRFHQLRHPRHPREMGAPKIAAFLTHQAVDQQIAASTQNQARSALLFLISARPAYRPWRRHPNLLATSTLPGILLMQQR
jgi:hypothetical protein